MNRTCPSINGDLLKITTVGPVRNNSAGFIAIINSFKCKLQRQIENIVGNYKTLENYSFNMKPCIYKV